MMSVFVKVAAFASIPVFTIILGGLVSIIKRPGGGLRSMILHFAAGVVFSVVSVEILPDIIENHQPLVTTVGFVAGFISMIGIRKITERNMETATSESQQRMPWEMLTGIAVDILVDGLLLGIGFAAGHTEGILLAIALSVEMLSLGMATATGLSSRKVSNRKCIAIIMALAIAFFISSVTGLTILRNASHTIIDAVLSFGLSALLFLVTEELLKEAHEERETVWHTSAFFFGFLLFVILGMYI